MASTNEPATIGTVQTPTGIKSGQAVEDYATGGYPDSLRPGRKSIPQPSFVDPRAYLPT